MCRKWGHSGTTDDRRTFTKGLGADKAKMHRDQTLGNNNKDGMFDSSIRLKRNVIVINLCDLCHDYNIYYGFAQKE